jgi:hypothetical protein
MHLGRFWGLDIKLQHGVERRASNPGEYIRAAGPRNQKVLDRGCGSYIIAHLDTNPPTP